MRTKLSRLKPATVVVYFTPGVFARIFSIFRARRVGALERRGVGKLQVQEHVALILIRQEARRHPAAEESRGRAEADQQHQRDGALADQRAGPADIAVRWRARTCD